MGLRRERHDERAVSWPQVPDAREADLDRRRLLDRGRGREQGLQGQRQGRAHPRHLGPRGRAAATRSPRSRSASSRVRDTMKIESRRPRGDGQEGARRHPRPLRRRGRGRRRPQGPRQHRRPRVRDRARRRQGRRGLQEVVPRPRHLRRRDRGRASTPC